MLKSRQKFGKYEIRRKLAEGGFATVYKAYDTIEGIPVALKIPHKRFVDKAALDDFRHEVRLTAKLDSPHILPIKNAAFINGQFVVATTLGQGTLDDLIDKRLPLKTVIDYADQMLDSLAHAHEHRVIHCDVKPENFILFPGNRLRLTDFGIAKLSQKTVSASGSGTVGYISPEQALGKPSLRSDVFSLGLILYHMLTKELPQWPYEWPMPGYERLRGKIPPDFIAFLRKAIEVRERKRFKDAVQMRSTFKRLKPKVLSYSTTRSRKSRRKQVKDLRSIRWNEFLRRYRSTLGVRSTCNRCGGPFAETMNYCPWCGTYRQKYHGPSSFPIRCRRCDRGMKLDWQYCAWCYGEGYEADGTRTYSDAKYAARCSNPRCKRKDLMPFMSYCPWCQAKVKKKWKFKGSQHSCPRCRWGIAKEFWDFCPWCARTLKR